MIHDVEYTFTIANLVKKNSHFKTGMKILYRSLKEEAFNGQPKTWVRGGYQPCYFKTFGRFELAMSKKLKLHSSRCVWSASFKFVFPWDNDVCYFAYGYPYTYTDLNRFLSTLDSQMFKNDNSILFKRELLCKTVLGNHCDIVTITDCNKKDVPKQAVVVSARVHPGETAGSWVMQGIIKYLTSHTRNAAILRENFVFKLIPMLNPDGVVHGTYRSAPTDRSGGSSSDNGADLNRKWHIADKNRHPTLYHAKVRIFLFYQHLETYCTSATRKRCGSICGSSRPQSRQRHFYFWLQKPGRHRITSFVS
jgi:hypothetical protein